MLLPCFYPSLCTVNDLPKSDARGLRARAGEQVLNLRCGAGQAAARSATMEGGVEEARKTSPAPTVTASPRQTTACRSPLTDRLTVQSSSYAIQLLTDALHLGLMPPTIPPLNHCVLFASTKSRIWRAVQGCSVRVFRRRSHTRVSTRNHPHDLII